MADNISKILAKHKNLLFVQRILHRDKYPVLDNKDGSISTHSMSYSSGDGKYYVYPTVVMGKDKKLKRLKGKEAWEHSKTNGAIPFDTEEEADNFSKNYKNVWKHKKYNDQQKKGPGE